MRPERRSTARCCKAWASTLIWCLPTTPATTSQPPPAAARNPHSTEHLNTALPKSLLFVTTVGALVMPRRSVRIGWMKVRRAVLMRKRVVVTLIVMAMTCNVTAYFYNFIVLNDSNLNHALTLSEMLLH